MHVPVSVQALRTSPSGLLRKTSEVNVARLPSGELAGKTFFYDWLYIHTLVQEENAALAEGILAYDAFTDIEFNPKRSINCQAEAAAIFVSLSRQGLLRDALESEDGFREIVFQGVASETAADPAGGQGHLF